MTGFFEVFHFQSIPQSVITDDFVKKSEVPSYDVHQREAKRQRQVRHFLLLIISFVECATFQLERSKSKGKNWYNMPAPELTEEKKNDLLAIQMRGGLYADKFFKKGSDTKGLPKYFQVSLKFSGSSCNITILCHLDRNCC